MKKRTATARPASAAAKVLASKIARHLDGAGVRTVFGVPGGGNNLEVVEACESQGLRFVLTHGETAAAIMASVDGELSGAPGACLATRGPGAASAINGIAQAMLDRAPVAAITDAVSASDRSRIAHQRLDHIGLFRPVTKWSGAVSTANADAILPKVLALASAPAPGPVHVDFIPDSTRSSAPIVPNPPRTASVADARDLLSSSRRPVIALGMGVRHSEPALRELLDGRPWPVLTTYKAKGAIPETWSNAAGLLTGATIEAPVLEAADLIVAIGLDPVELIPAPWLYTAPVLALSEWPVTDGYLTPRLALTGRLSELLELVAQALGEDFDGEPFGRATRLAAQAPLLEAPAREIGPQHVVLAARRAAPKGTIATIDSGAHMLVAMPLWEVEAPREALISSGLATMGFALPAAIAAALANRAQHVLCLTGDGGLGMALAELETVSRLQLAIVVVVFNDSSLSLIEIKQRPGAGGGKNAVRFRSTDYAQIANGVGIAARRVTERRDLAAALTEAFASRRPFLLDVAVDPGGYLQIMDAIRGQRPR